VDIINLYIDWKKNIKFEEVFELNVLFDISYSDSLKRNIKNWIKTIPNLKLKNFILERGFEPTIRKGPNVKNQYRSFESYDTLFDELIGDSIFSPRLNYGFTSDETRDWQSCYFNLISELYPQETIEEIINDSCDLIYMIMVSNPINFSWEMQYSVGAYKFKKGIDIVLDPKSRKKKVDISKRHGRMTAIGNCYFKGASEYYFGPRIFNKISIEKILAFKNAEKIEKLKHNIIYVKLFDEQDYWEDFARKRLADFRAHLEIDRLEYEYLNSIKHL